MCLQYVCMWFFAFSWFFARLCPRSPVAWFIATSSIETSFTFYISSQELVVIIDNGNMQKSRSVVTFAYFQRETDLENPNESLSGRWVKKENSPQATRYKWHPPCVKEYHRQSAVICVRLENIQSHWSNISFLKHWVEKASKTPLEISAVLYWKLIDPLGNISTRNAVGICTR